MRAILFLAILVYSFCAYAQCDFPTEKQIHDWLRNNGENVDIYDHNKANIITVFLKNHEKAYIVPVSLKNEGRNELFRTALVRPEIGEAKVLSSYIKQLKGVYDFNNDRVSELFVSEIYSGGGTMEGTIAIVNLDGWQVVKLFERHIKSNNGTYSSKNKEYYDDQCFWEFNRLEKSFDIELHETCMQIKSATLAPPKKNEKTYRFENGVFKGKQIGHEIESGHFARA